MHAKIGHSGNADTNNYLYKDMKLVLFTQLLQSQALFLVVLISLSECQFCIDVHDRCQRSEI